MGVRSDPVDGIVVFDARMIDGGKLAANDAAATNSSYSQAGSRPGRVTPVAGQTLAPAISGGQGDDSIGIRVERSGLAGAAGLSYTIDGGTTYRGWMTPRLVGWEPLTGLWTTTKSWTRHRSVTIPKSQKIVTVYCEPATGSIYCQVRDPVTGWGSANTVTATSANGVCLYLTPDGSRLVLVVAGTSDKLRSYYSEDDGATWLVLGRAADVNVTVPTATTDGILKGCFVGEDMALFVRGTGAPDPWYQYASSDGGITWTLVGSSTIWGVVDVDSDGQRCILVATDQATGTKYQYKLISSAYTDASTVSGGDIDTGITNTLEPSVLWDADGGIRFLGGELAAGVNTRTIYASFDAGVTWLGPLTHFTSGSTESPQAIDLVSQVGKLVMVSNWFTGGSYNGSLTSTNLTCWSNVEITGTVDHTWLAVELPNTWSGSWAFGGATAGTLAVSHLQIATTSSTGNYTYTGSGTSLTAGAHFVMNVQAGGATLFDWVSASLKACNGSDTYEIKLRFSTTQFAVVDIPAVATATTITVDMTVDREFILGFTAAGVPFLAYKLPTDTVWTVVDLTGYGAFTSTGAGSAAWTFKWGHNNSSTSTSNYKWIALYADVDEILTGNALLGKEINGHPYPLADVVDADGNVGHLAVRGGVALNGENYTIDPEFDYALSSAFPGVSPSPYAAEWRSKDTTEQRIAWDFSVQTYLGGAYGVLVQQCNFKTAYFEYYDGAAWQIIATYNGAEGTDSLEYDRTGEAIYPSSTPGPSDRPIHENEFSDGGWVNLASTYQRKVRDNTGGWWTTSNTAKASINLEGITGSEPASDGFDLVSSGGLLLAYPTSQIVRRRFRLRIPAQDCPDSYFRAGILAPGRLIPFGQALSWGAGRDIEGVYETFEDDAGAESRSRRGSSDREIWTLGFSDGVPSIDYYESEDAPYIGVSGGTRLEAVGSVLAQLRGIVSRTKGQTIPVVAVMNLPTSTITITDRHRYLYGYLTGPISASIDRGTQGINGVDRITGLRVVGLTG